MRAVAYIFLNPTSGFRLRRALAPIVWNPLLAALLFPSWTFNVRERDVGYKVVRAGNRAVLIIGIPLKVIINIDLEEVAFWV